jgi:hypothetical protein
LNNKWTERCQNEIAGHVNELEAAVAEIATEKSRYSVKSTHFSNLR